MNINVHPITTRQNNILIAYEKMKNCLNESHTSIKHLVANLHESPKVPQIIHIPENWHKSLTAISNHWSKISNWSCEQAAVLSLEINPKLIERIRDKRKYFTDYKGKVFTIMPSYQDIFKEFFAAELLEEYLDRYQIFETQFRFNLHPSLKMIEWSIHRGIFFLSELTEEVKKFSNDHIDWKNHEKRSKHHEQHISGFSDQTGVQHDLIRKQQKDLDSKAPVLHPNKQTHPKEKESMLKIIAVMARGGYGHDPNQKKSPTVGTIHEDALKYGVSLDEDTIRKYLKHSTDCVTQN